MLLLKVEYITSLFKDDSLSLTMKFFKRCITFLLSSALFILNNQVKFSLVLHQYKEHTGTYLDSIKIIK